MSLAAEDYTATFAAGEWVAPKKPRRRALGAIACKWYRARARDAKRAKRARDLAARLEVKAARMRAIALTWFRGVERQVEPRAVSQRLDWITYAFRVPLDRHVLAKLVERANAAKGAKAAIILPGWEGEIRRDKQGRFLLESQRERILIWETAPGRELVAGVAAPGWTVTVDMSGVALLASGWETAIVEAWRIAAVFGTPLESRRRRLDLAVDLVGFPIQENDARALVKRSKKPPARYFGETRGGPQQVLPEADVDPEDRKFRLHGFGGEVQTMSVGAGGSVMMRVYCKTTELAHAARDWKREAEQWGWARGGWQGERVTRVEFQVTSEALEELALRKGVMLADVDPTLAAAVMLDAKHERDELLEDVDARDRRLAWRREAATKCARRDLARVSDALDGTWAYLTRKWVRLVKPGTASRLSRCNVDPRWSVIQGIVWRQSAAPFKRFRRPTAALSKQALGTLLSLLARANMLPMLVSQQGEVIEDEKDFAAELGRAGTARAAVMGGILGIAKASASIIAADIFGDFTDQAAAEYLATKWNAKRARFERSFTTWTPPPPASDVDDYRPTRGLLPRKASTVLERGQVAELFASAS